MKPLSLLAAVHARWNKELKRKVEGHPPRFDASGTKVQNAQFLKVVHNGVLIHENVAVAGPTNGASFADEKPVGPLMLQGDHGPVAFRNLRIQPVLSTR